jgi:hypothetical protein
MTSSKFGQNKAEVPLLAIYLGEHPVCLLREYLNYLLAIHWAGMAVGTGLEVDSGIL